MAFWNGVSSSQSSVFRFLKLWYDASTARLDRFSHISLKLTLGLQNLCCYFRFALFDGEIYPLEPISKRKNRHIPSCSICDRMFIFFIFWVLAFWIFVSNGTVSSKLSIFSSIRFYLLLLDLVSVRSQGGWGEQYFTLEGF